MVWLTVKNISSRWAESVYQFFCSVVTGWCFTSAVSVGILILTGPGFKGKTRAVGESNKALLVFNSFY
ncbi:MAG: hypothetical protein CSA49_05305 [Gammaproteobacteria bacterium]|nr:MAG: hypothetical protein CSA49_05305 [Gammaproteobacteria bacterium]